MNHVSARILVVVQLVLFFGGLVGMIYLLHILPDPAFYPPAIEAGAEQTDVYP